MKIPSMFLCSVMLYASFAAGQTGNLRRPENITTDAVVARLTENNRRRQQELQAYTGRRTYHLLYTGFPGRHEAEMVVEASYEAPGKKTFSIVSHTGSQWIVDRVFKKLLETEKEVADAKSQANTALTNDNYRFDLVGQEVVEGRPAYVLKVEPKADSKLLYRGTIWVDSVDFAVAKIDAEPAKRPSLWISKTVVHHTYGKIGDFWLPLQNQSTTDVRVGGHAALAIQYADYKVLPQGEHSSSQAVRSIDPANVTAQISDGLPPSPQMLNPH